jgi:hypothetical protein
MSKEHCIQYKGSLLFWQLVKGLDWLGHRYCKVSILENWWRYRCTGWVSPTYFLMHNFPIARGFNSVCSRCPHLASIVIVTVIIIAVIAALIVSVKINIIHRTGRPEKRQHIQYHMMSSTADVALHSEVQSVHSWLAMAGFVHLYPPEGKFHDWRHFL